MTPEQQGDRRRGRLPRDQSARGNGQRTTTRPGTAPLGLPEESPGADASRTAATVLAAMPEVSLVSAASPQESPAIDVGVLSMALVSLGGFAGHSAAEVWREGSAHEVADAIAAEYARLLQSQGAHRVGFPLMSGQSHGEGHAGGNRAGARTVVAGPVAASAGARPRAGDPVVAVRGGVHRLPGRVLVAEPLLAVPRDSRLGGRSLVCGAQRWST